MIVFENHPITKNKMTKSLEEKLDRMQQNYNKINSVNVLSQDLNQDKENTSNENNPVNNLGVNNEFTKLLPLINLLKDKQQNSNQLQEMLLKNLGMENSLVSSLLPMLMQMSNKKNEQSKTSVSSIKKEDTQISSYLKTDEYKIN